MFCFLAPTRRQWLAQCSALITGVLSSRLGAQSLGENAPGPPRALTGTEQPSLVGFDRMLSTFCDEKKVPGAALAVTRRGRLVYARGCGYADRQGKQPVEPTSLFRIASISKPLTAVAILQLVEQNKLKLAAKVHELLRLEKPADERWKQIAVEHLLHHSGGWDSAISGDPMFKSREIVKQFETNPPAKPAEIVRHVLGKPLDFDPGSRYAYSNFGFSLLGRVIEHVAHQPYELYVRKHMLEPLGIRRTRLGKTLLRDRAKGEVHYFDAGDHTGPSVMDPSGEQVPRPYGAWCLESMDSHGGWIASAVDLVRFASAFDGPTEGKILNAASIATMFARPAGEPGRTADDKPKPVYYGCGWNVRAAGPPGHFNTWHNGGLDGTSTILVRRHDGLNWVVLFNAGEGPDGRPLAAEIDGRVHQAANEVTEWPSGDRFEKYL